MTVTRCSVSRFVCGICLPIEVYMQFASQWTVGTSRFISTSQADRFGSYQYKRKRKERTMQVVTNKNEVDAMALKLYDKCYIGHVPSEWWLKLAAFVIQERDNAVERALEDKDAKCP